MLVSMNQMRAMEQKAIAYGVDSFTLMRRAGEAVASIALGRFAGRDFLVLVGPGNNGGDGCVAAEVLRQAGCNVRVRVFGTGTGTGDAARARVAYKGEVCELAKEMPRGNPVVIDALFGTGLSRPIEGGLEDYIDALNAGGGDVIAVDIPSGVNGDSGAVMGVALKASLSVTFAAKKYGHLLMPGRIHCGEVVVADIGCSPLAGEQYVSENSPGLWQAKLPWPKPDHHKYHRGHTLVWAGFAKHAGAARLASMAALRTGSGLVSIVCASKDVPVYAASTWSLMTDTHDQWSKLLDDTRKNTVLIGPGAGVGKPARDAALAALKKGKRAVLDADALSSFASHPHTLFKAIRLPVILTPHAGEFAKLFAEVKESNKIASALKAAKLSNAVVVYKGYDTVIAAPDGRCAVNANAPATLATAGTGDTLAGICAGWLAQGLESFDAACAAVWMHGEAARQQGAGLIAEDLLQHLPSVLEALKVTS